MSKIADIFTFALVVAAILVLTRPGSQGPGFVTAIGNAFSAIVNAVTGGAQTSYWPPANTTVGSDGSIKRGAGR